MITIANTIRYCEDIGMYAIDRPRSSCRHATSFCRAHCFNKKLEACYTNMKTKDKRNAEAWKEFVECPYQSIAALEKSLSRRKYQTKRIRLMTRGEAFNSMSDIYAIRDLLIAMPERIFWIPTRAWRNPILREAIERMIMQLHNARVQASVDPSNTKEELDSIRNWSTLFFGDNEQTQGRTLCQKTWRKEKGACATCEGACFAMKQTYVHLKKH